MILMMFVSLAFAQTNTTIDINPHLPYSPPPGDEKMESDYVETRERIVKKDGVEYREIQYNDQFFYVNARQPESIVNCSTVPLSSPKQYAVDGGVQVGQRARIYIESLRQHCDGMGMVTSQHPHDTNVGVSWKGDKPGDSEKKVFINPVQRTGGFGTSF
jgi:hypothetical protein